MYSEAEKLANADTSLLTAAVYKLPKDLGREGFETSELAFAGASFGVPIEACGPMTWPRLTTWKRTALAINLRGTAAKSCRRALTKDDRPVTDMGVISVIARESAAFSGKALLACEFVSSEDLEAMKQLQAK
ncbi:hypothetical protein [Rhizobium sp. BR 315]|uniref:hypothetical protein n=1 Tax=Rhizobium sp. BR 315 TaxID=3040014 RepID=UPI003D32F908